MAQNDLSFLIVVASGFILLRPADVPVIARGTGRLAGMTVRAMRNLKDLSEKAIKESANLAKSEAPEMVEMRKTLKKSISQFDSLSTTFQRDMADVPLNPASLVRRGLRSLENVADTDGKDENEKTTKLEPSRVSISRPTPSVNAYQAVMEESQRARIRQSVNPTNSTTSTGADFLARCIEEAALAQVEKDMFGSATEEDNKSK